MPRPQFDFQYVPVVGAFSPIRRPDVCGPLRWEDALAPIFVASPLRLLPGPLASAACPITIAANKSPIQTTALVGAAGARMGVIIREYPSERFRRSASNPSYRASRSLVASAVRLMFEFDAASTERWKARRKRNATCVRMLAAHRTTPQKPSDGKTSAHEDLSRSTTLATHTSILTRATAAFLLSAALLIPLQSAEARKSGGERGAGGGPKIALPASRTGASRDASTSRARFGERAPLTGTSKSGPNSVTRDHRGEAPRPRQQSIRGVRPCRNWAHCGRYYGGSPLIRDHR